MKLDCRAIMGRYCGFDPPISELRMVLNTDLASLEATSYPKSSAM